MTLKVHASALPLFLATLSSSQPVEESFAKAAHAITPRLIELRRDLHRYPELSNREFRTGKIIAARLRELGLGVRYPIARTGVVAVLRGGVPGQSIALRVDLDALPILEERDSPYRSRHPGIMHACGHDAHAAVGVAVAELLAGVKERLRGTVVFLFQPAEEGVPEAEEGGAALMIREGALDDPRPTAVLGFHVDPTLDTGHVGWTDGTVFASRDHFRIRITGRIAHSATPEAGLDAIRVAAEILREVHDLPQDRRAMVSIGTIRGGRHYNVVADEVHLEGVARALTDGNRATLMAELNAIVEGVTKAHGAKATLTFVRPGTAPTVNSGALARAVRPTLARVYGTESVIRTEPQMGAEDFSAYAERVPGMYLRMGVRNQERGITAMTHTPTFDLDEAALPLAARALASLLWDLLASPPPSATPSTLELRQEP